jgi:hypothetical protein
MGANGGLIGVTLYRGTKKIHANGGDTGIHLGLWDIFEIVGIAVDLDNRKIWFIIVAGTALSDWNDDGSADPAANTGGISVPAGTMVPFCTFGGSGGIAGDAVTANFGANAFAGVVPSGFTAGWPL